MVQASNPCTEKPVKYQIMMHGICFTLKIIIIIIIIVVVVVVVIFVKIFMQGIYSYIPKTNSVSRVHNVAAVLYLQFVLHLM